MKKRKLLICILLLALAAMLASACGGQKTTEEIIKENGATVKITLDLAGGVSSDKTVRYLYIHEGAPLALPWEETGGKGIINPPARDGYRLEGFYHGEKDEEGNITYGAKWDRSERFSEDTTLYARWVLPFVFRVFDGEGNVLKDFPVNPGDKFDASDRAAAAVDGYTFIAYYKDQALTEPLDGEIIHPGYPDGKTSENATEEDYVYPVYARYVEGVYKKVYTPSDFTFAENYWLIGENGVLDFEGKNFPVLRQFTGKLVGNGVTIKNAAITRENAADSDLGLFGKLVGASLSDVTFENCTYSVKFTRKPQGVSVVRAGFLAGTAEGTVLTNVTFRNCVVGIEIAGSGGGNPVVPCEYEDTENPLWANRAEDASRGNSLQGVEGTVQLNVI